MNDTCENCKYWNKGLCVIHPPQILVIDLRYGAGWGGERDIRRSPATRWPETCSDDWCGEYKER